MSKCTTQIGAAILAALALFPSQSFAEPFLGEIRWVGFNFAPRGWAMCNGQLLSIAQNTALFSLLGTQFGGDGRVTFALPDMRGRHPVHMGQGPGLSNYDMGQLGGQEYVTLTLDQMPAHNHPALANPQAGTTHIPTGLLPSRVIAVDPDGDNPSMKAYRAVGDNSVTLAPEHIGVVGGSQPHNNLAPHLTLNCIIAMVGIFPSRD